MNRIRKYRAYDTKNKTWIQNIGMQRNNILTDGTEAHIHLMDFIGLTDKNGKEIFEGDVIEVARNIKYVVEYVNEAECDGETYFATFVLYANEQLFYPIDEYGINQGKIIGNIHENPDLLKYVAHNI